jgi:hypothetical protein
MMHFIAVATLIINDGIIGELFIFQLPFKQPFSTTKPPIFHIILVQYYQGIIPTIS